MDSRKLFIEKLDYMRMVHGITRRVIQAFPEDKLDWTPAEGSRTARQIIAHVYGMLASHAAAVLKGSLTEEEHNAAERTPEGGVGELLDWCEARFDEFQRDARLATDEQLASKVKFFYGEFAGGTILMCVLDEHWHHRGQLTVYLRLLGITPPNLYDYGQPL